MKVRAVSSQRASMLHLVAGLQNQPAEGQSVACVPQYWPVAERV